MTCTTFLETVTCPEGHPFKIRRRVAGIGTKVNTRCKVCTAQFVAVVGSPPARAAAEATRGPTRESQIEDRLVQRVKQTGGEVRKVSWLGRKGAPDRLVMLPDRGVLCDAENNGRYLGPKHPAATIWVELKAPGKAAGFPRTPHERAQHREHERMRKMGQRVEVIDSYEQIEELLK